MSAYGAFFGLPEMEERPQDAKLPQMWKILGQTWFLVGICRTVPEKERMMRELVMLGRPAKPRRGMGYWGIYTTNPKK